MRCRLLQWRRLIKVPAVGLESVEKSRQHLIELLFQKKNEVPYVYFYSKATRCWLDSVLIVVSKSESTIKQVLFLTAIDKYWFDIDLVVLWLVVVFFYVWCSGCCWLFLMVFFCVWACHILVYQRKQQQQQIILIFIIMNKNLSVRLV